MEKHTMIALSTAHIAEATVEFFKKLKNAGIVVYSKGDYGWFVYVPEYFEGFKDNGDFPDDLYLCMKYAHDNGCEWIMFDQDVDVNEAPELPVYDWWLIYGWF